MRRAVFGFGFHRLPEGLQGVTEVIVGLGTVGLELEPARYSASASAPLPWAAKALPSSSWALAWPGLSFSAVRYSASASAGFA